ncbi:MAG TPA: hypothetical protein VMQ65_01180 [Candidatus Limnocylindria bacterium]|nr:hypothetical protein [Candidatus Limnocylindria bacterium]
MRAWLGPVRRWVRLYTAGLEPSVRDRRRDEIDADLWDQVDWLTGNGRTAAAITMAVWLRWLSGVPDDVFWRRDQPRAARSAPAPTEGRRDMFGSGSRAALVLPVGAVAIAIAVAIASLVIGEIQHQEQSERLVSSELLGSIHIGLLAAGLASLVAGFAIMRSRPAVGAVLAVGGSWVAGLMAYWLIVPLLIAVAISFYAMRRARRIAAEAGS